MNNTNKWETPIMNELGSEFTRSSYDAAALGKGIFKPVKPNILIDKVEGKKC